MCYNNVSSAPLPNLRIFCVPPVPMPVATLPQYTHQKHGRRAIFLNSYISPSLLFSQDSEVFVDTINTPTYRKKLKKLSAQDPRESRRRWQHVTEALRNKDIEAATDAKHAVRRIAQLETVRWGML